MADYLATSAPGLHRIGEARPTSHIMPCNMGDPTYTAGAARFFGQPYISKGLGDTPPQNPLGGNRAFQYNWGADKAFNGRKPACMFTDSFAANHAGDFAQVFNGPNNIRDYRATGTPSTYYGLYQRDSRIMRQNLPTDVTVDFGLFAKPTATGRELGLTGRDVYAEKMAMNLSKYKAVQMNLRR